MAFPPTATTERRDAAVGDAQAPWSHISWVRLPVVVVAIAVCAHTLVLSSQRGHEACREDSTDANRGREIRPGL